MMTLEQQRIAIAEWSGVQLGSHFAKWKLLGDGWRECEVCGRKQAACYEWPICGYPNIKLPDYPNDLNAIHEAEKGLERDVDKDAYATYLFVLQGADLKRLQRDMDDGEQWWWVATATAAQRSEALCRTLWPERFTE